MIQHEEEKKRAKTLQAQFIHIIYLEMLIQIYVQTSIKCKVPSHQSRPRQIIIELRPEKPTTASCMCTLKALLYSTLQVYYEKHKHRMIQFIVVCGMKTERKKQKKQHKKVGITNQSKVYIQKTFKFNHTLVYSFDIPSVRMQRYIETQKKYSFCIA